MPGLLSADRVAELRHALVDVLVAHGRLHRFNAQRVQRTVQAEVRHDRGHDRVRRQLSPLLQVLAAEVEDVVARDDIALLVHAQAAIRIAVKRKAHVQTLFHDKALQGLDVRRTRIAVDVRAVRRVVQNENLSAELPIQPRRQAPGAAVGAVQTNAHPREGLRREAQEMLQIEFSTLGIIDDAANGFPLRQGKLGRLPVQVCLDEIDHLVLHLLSPRVQELDSVVIEGIVAGGDHDATVKAHFARDIRNRGRGRDVQQVRLRAGGGQAPDQRVLEHVARSPRVLAHRDAHGTSLPRFSILLLKVPSKEAPDLVRMLRRELDVRLAPEAVGSKILSHLSLILSTKSYL